MNYPFNKRQQFRTFREKNRELALWLKDPDSQRQEITELYKYLSFLGYDLKGEYIFTHINDKTSQLEWLSTKKGKRKIQFYDFINKVYEKKEEQFHFQDHILKHTYPFELKKAVPYRHANSGTTDERIVMHYSLNTFGASFKNITDILPIDIDCHKGNSLQSLNEYHILKSFLIKKNIKPLLIERSYEGGYHIFIKLDKEYSLRDKKQWIKEFNEEHETSFESPSAMRFPFSYSYCTILFDEDDTLFNNIRNYRILYKNHENTCLILNKTEQQQDQKITTEKEIEKPIPIVSAIYQRQSKNRIKHYTPEEFLKETDIIITRGHRHNEMLELVRIGKFNGWTIDEIKFIIMQLNLSSKDLSIWSDYKIRNEIEKMYQKCVMYYNGKSTVQPEDFISNVQYIPLNIRELIESEYLIKSILYNIKRKITDKNIIKCRIILMEMIGLYYYNTLNPKQTKNNRPDKYLKGMQYPQVFSEKLKNYYSEDLLNTDVHFFLNEILTQSGLFSQYKFNSRGWYYNFFNKENNYCRLFNLRSNINIKIISSIELLSFHILLTFKQIENLLYNNDLLYRGFFYKIKVLNERFLADNNYLSNTG